MNGDRISVSGKSEVPAEDQGRVFVVIASFGSWADNVKVLNVTGTFGYSTTDRVTMSV